MSATALPANISTSRAITRTPKIAATSVHFWSQYSTTLCGGHTQNQQQHHTQCSDTQRRSENQ
jgi:hypothetical protein